MGCRKASDLKTQKLTNLIGVYENNGPKRWRKLLVFGWFGKLEKTSGGSSALEEYEMGHRGWLSHPVKPARFDNRIAHCFMLFWQPGHLEPRFIS